MKAPTCPACRDNEVSTSIETDNFVFRSGGVDYSVSAEVPVHSCGACGETFISEIGESARHAAICHAMQRLTPQQIYALRHDRLGLSRKHFAALSGIGEASLARWESGEFIQSESNDNLLRLLTSLDNVAALRELRSPGPVRPETAQDAHVVLGSDTCLDLQRYPALEDADIDRLLTQGSRFRLKRAS